MNILGVNCSPDLAYLALAADGKLREGQVEYIEAPTLGESSEELLFVLEELCRVMGEVEADRVMLLKPEHHPWAKRTHSEFVPRIALETLVRVAAVKTETPVELLSRPTLRARLRLPTEGKLAEHVSLCIPAKVGKNWSEERQLAALAALAGEETL